MNEQTSLLNGDGSHACDNNKERKPSNVANADKEPQPCVPMQKICFGLGHVYNDLCAAVWFSYTLFYFQIVLQMDPTTAGTLIMIGQVADSLATPSAGWAVDWISTPRVWHLTGTGLVAIGFTLMFSYAPTASANPWWSFCYYAILVVFFQIGWAIVQISHLSIITTIAKDNRQTSALTSIRYTASVCCNVFVYVITWAILKNGNSNAMNQLGPNDFYKFKEIILIITCVGIVCSLIFYCGMNTTTTLPPTHSATRTHRHRKVEVAHANDQIKSACSNGNAYPAKSFLKSLVTYQVSIMYMSSRLYTILNLIYIPLYLEERLSDDNEVGSIRGAVASVPLMCFASSFLTSLLINNRPMMINDKIVFALGSVISLIGCVWIAIGIPDGTISDIYAVAVIIGAGGSATMITSLCLTAQFVNNNGFKSGSVYSTVTFTDKLISGAAVLLIQHMECGDRTLCPNFYKNVLAYASASSTVLGIIALGTLQCHNPLMIH